MCNNPVPFRSIQSKTYFKYKEYGNVASYMDSLLLPCGNCLGCRLDKLALWTARCNYELYKNRSAFLTFTYDDYHLKYKDDSALLPSLFRDDLHKYIDNLRHKIKAMPVMPKGSKRDFSYFGVGEYGGHFERPHYHVLFFGLDFADFKKIFYDSWKKGYIKSLPILSGGLRYVIDYFTKENVSGKLAESLYDDTFRERPFNVVSRGLGSELFYQHRDEIRKGKDLHLGFRIVPVPPYYRNLYCTYSDDDVFSRAKINRQHVKEIEKEAEKHNYPSVDSYLEYVRRANELSLESRFRRDNVPVKASYKEIYEISDIPLMARNALSFQ